MGKASAIHAFIVIAGFYTAMLLSGKFSEERGGTVRAFYFSRFARLYPTFITCVLLTLVWDWWVKTVYPIAPGGSSIWTPVSNLLACTQGMSAPAALLIWLPNLTLIGSDLLPLFNTVGGNALEIANHTNASPPWGADRMWLGFGLIIPPSWSLGMIFSFYLITPLVVRAPTIKRAGLLGGVSVLVWFGFGSLFFYGGYFVGVFWYWLFCLGMLSFFAYRGLRSALTKMCSNSGFRTIAFAGTVGAFFWMFTLDSGLGDVGRGFIVAGLLPVAAVASKGIRMDRYAGRLSYPIFCSHMLFLSVAELVVREGGFYQGWRLPITFAGSLVFSVMAVRYLEQPLEGLRTKITEVFMSKRAGEAGNMH